MSILTISNGTTTIDLLSAAGFKLSEWAPSYMTQKDGGIWADSPMAHGSALALSKEADLEDTYTLVARHTTQNSFLEGVGDLVRLLESALDYWRTSWQSAPVYISAQEPNETNVRYAVVKGYRLNGFAGPFGREMVKTLCHMAHKLDLTLIHGPWQNVAIGSATDLQVSGTQSASLLSSASYSPAQSGDDAHVNTATGVITSNSAELRFGDGGTPTLDSGNYQPNNNADDAYVITYASGINSTHNYLNFGRQHLQGVTDGGFYYDVETPLSAGIVFNLAADIPATAHITGAYIRFTAYGTNYGSVIRTNIRGEAAAAPGVFTTYEDFRDRVRTTKSVTWDFSTPWIKDSTYDTPDLSAIIQEIITAYGAVNDLTLFIEDDGSDYTAVRRSYAYDDPAGAPPTLYVTWTEPGAESPRHCGIRFKNLTIPLGATILSAKLRLYSTTAEATAASADIRYEQSVTPAAFSTYADFMGRPRGAAHVLWAVPAWAQNTWYESPEIASLLQEYVNSWVGSAATEVTIFIENNGSPGVMKRPAAYDSGAHLPQLNVTWTVGASATFGCTATTDDAVYVVNKCNGAQLTHIHWYDASTLLASANRCGQAVHGITPDPVGNNDCVYFGISDLASQTGPFDNLVFTVSTAATYSGNAYVIWEYWNGAAWTALNVSDDTVALGGMTFYGAAGGRPWGRTGSYSVAWEQPSDWAIYTVPQLGVSAWWVRARVSMGTGTMTRAANGTRPIYTALWNDVNVAAAQVLGDVRARGRIRATAHIAVGQPNGYSSRLLIGARSIGRSAPSLPFDSFVNLSDAQNNPSYSVSAGALGPFTGGTGNLNAAPTGRWIHATLTTLQEDIAAYISFGSRSYEGTYHAYLRYIPTYSASIGASWPLRVRVEEYLTHWSSDWAPLYNNGTTNQRMYIADLGRLRLHGMTPMKTETSPLLRVSDQPVLYLYLYNPTAVTAEVELIDLVLMPADEWLGDVRIPHAPLPTGTGIVWPGNATGSLALLGKYLDIDSARVPYYHTLSVLRNGARSTGTNDTLIYSTSATEPVSLQANAEQNLHFLAMIQDSATTGDSLWCSYPLPMFSVQLSAVYRYSLARGSR